MNTITYHRVGHNDVQTLIDYRTAFSLELAGEHPLEIVDALKIQMKNYFVKAISNNDCIAYLAKENSEIAGIGTIILREQPGNFKNPSGRVGYLMNMYTVPKFRRKGICTGILNSLINEARAIGITTFELHSTKAGEAVYTSSGFELHNEPTFRKYF
ncbi:MAG: GNAT family N-acetyltransferase [Bacteroidetes bacterium]|nr:GNAT family N-acetyltransferase [Bacteroidota bacterium]